MTTTIGSLLIQPQVLSRLQGHTPAEALADEVVALLQRVLLDPAAAQALAPALQSAGEALGMRLAERVRTRLPQGLAALQGLLAPLLARFTALASGGASAPELLGRIAEALDALAGATGSLSDDAIRAFVRRLARIAEQDFGLSLAFFTGELRAFVAEFRDALEGGVSDGSGEAATRHALGCLLARLERDLFGQVPAFVIDADRIAGLLIAELRRTGLSDLRDQAACLIGKLQAVLRALADLSRALAAQAAGGAGALHRPQPGAATGQRPQPGAALRQRARPAVARDLPSPVPPRIDDGRFCWYASWLYATRRQGFGSDEPFGAALLQTITPGYPEDEVWLSTDRLSLVLRRARGADELLYRSATPIEWHQAPQFSGQVPVKPVFGTGPAEYFVFPEGRIGAEFLETWAQVTAVLADAAAGFWHLLAMAGSPKEHACNIPLWLWKWTQAASSAASAPLPSLLAQKAGWGMGGKYLYSPLMAMLTVIAGSFEGVHSKTNAGNIFLQWLTLIGGDALGAFKIHAVTQGVRGFSLSLFTLINQEGASVEPDGDDTRPANWSAAGPIIGAVNMLCGMAFIGLIRREDHGLPIGGNWTRLLLLQILASPVAGFVGGYCGALVGWAVARTVTPDQMLKEPGKAAAIGFLSFIVQMYVSMEGDTDEGRYNPRVTPDGDDFATPRQPFAGYPPAASSPYRLPCPAGTSTYVGQANQGFFSHMRYGDTVQVYAYDFAHDFGDEILCVRDGTVVDWFDFYPDDTNLDLNGSAAHLQTGRAAASAAQTAGLLVNGQSGFGGNLTGNWNFVLIRHDTQDPVHDRDQGGAAVFTFAEYGHGQTGGVRAAFALRGIAPAAIIGTPVQRGQVVMLAGDTGVSFHNHLHLHVRAATAATPATVIPLAAPFTPITNTLSPYTLPFVFAEATHPLGSDGPLRHLRWYRSQNTRLG